MLVFIRNVNTVENLNCRVLTAPSKDRSDQDKSKFEYHLGNAYNANYGVTLPITTPLFIKQKLLSSSAGRSEIQLVYTQMHHVIKICHPKIS